MSKRPGRNSESSPFRKRQLSSDAKIIITLLKKQPQTKKEICENTKISDPTFYRIISLLQEQQIIKCIDHLYSLWNFDFLEKRVEDALSKLLRENPVVYSGDVVNEVGKPWPQIEGVTYEIVKKLGLTITMIDDKTVFLKTN